MSQDFTEYYQSEVNKLGNKDLVIVLYDCSGERTKNLSVNAQSAAVIIAKLKKVITEQNINALYTKVLLSVGLKDIAKDVEGELPEISNEHGTASWGNGELLIWPDGDESGEAHTFYMSNSRGFDELVRD